MYLNIKNWLFLHVKLCKFCGNTIKKQCFININFMYYELVQILKQVGGVNWEKILTMKY